MSGAPLPGSRRPRARIALAALALLAAAPASRAEAKPKAPPGSLVYIQKGAIWRASLVEPEQPEKLLALPALRRRFTRLEAAGDGSALLVELGRNAAWIDLSGEGPFVPVYLPCRGRARLSPDGHRVLCGSRMGQGTAIYQMRPRVAGALLLPAFDPAATTLADLAGEQVLVAQEGGLWRAPVAQPDQRKQVSPHVPVGALSVAPDGARAVGRYTDPGTGDSLFSFRLDGEAVRRKLGPGVPVSWSADSGWLAVLGENTACAVRAVGGEYKCWDRFRPLSLASDGTWLLLAKPPKGRARRLDLFLGRIGGPRAERPLKLVRGVAAALLVP